MARSPGFQSSMAADGAWPVERPQEDPPFRIEGQQMQFAAIRVRHQGVEAHRRPAREQRGADDQAGLQRLLAGGIGKNAGFTIVDRICWHSGTREMRGRNRGQVACR